MSTTILLLTLLPYQATSPADVNARAVLALSVASQKSPSSQIPLRWVRAKDGNWALYAGKTQIGYWDGKGYYQYKNGDWQENPSSPPISPPNDSLKEKIIPADHQGHSATRDEVIYPIAPVSFPSENALAGRGGGTVIEVIRHSGQRYQVQFGQDGSRQCIDTPRGRQ